MQSDGSYSAFSPIVHGDIALSINTEYIKNTIQINLQVPCHCRPTPAYRMDA